MAHMGQGPYGPGPIWARAHMGPGPLGPGPLLVGQTPHQKTHPKKYTKNTIWTLFYRVRFLVRCLPNKEGPGAQGPGAHMGPGPYGPWPIWALAHMGLGPYGRSLAYQIFSIPDY